MKILFFLDTIHCGGKERRALELISFLKEKKDYEISLVVIEKDIFYKYVYELGIPIIIIERKFTKYDPLLFIKFYKYCCSFKPDIIHSWGIMSTFYAIPTKLILRVPLISSMIADSQRNFAIFSLPSLLFQANIYFSNIILSNSKAGLAAYKVKTKKAKVIWNGVHLERFQQKFDSEKVRKVFGIKTNFIIVMVAAFSTYKDYDLFLDIAKEIRKIRDDITLIGVGDGPKMEEIQQRIKNEQIDNVLLTGRQKEIEPIVAASDIGLLCSRSEGISNSIIESMALGKPIITTDINGGSKEIIIEGVTGYCTDRNVEKIIVLINLLLDNSDLRISMGAEGRERISSFFSIGRMGNDFMSLYKEVLA